MAAKSIGGLDTFFSENKNESEAAKGRIARQANINQKTATNDATKDSEIRATFIVQKKRLEQLKAIAYWDCAKIKDIHDAALEMYIESRIDDIPKVLVNRKDKKVTT